MDQDLTIFVAPYAIIIGRELIAIGSLTLFGYPWIVKTRTQGTLAIFTKSSSLSLARSKSNYSRQRTIP